MQLSAQAGGGPADAVASAGPQRGKGRAEEVGADVVDHTVDARSAGDFPHPLPNILIFVVDHHVRAQGYRLGCFFGAASGGDDFGADDVFGHLDGGGANARGGGEHQDGLPRFQLQPPHQHVPDWQVGGGGRRGLLKGNAVGQQVGVGRRYRGIFCVAAVDGTTQEPGASAEVVLSSQARRALHATKAGVHHNSVAGFEPSHAVADLRDLTGAVSAENQGRRKFPLQPPAAVSGVEVQAVQRRGPDPDLDLARLHLRLRALAEGQYLRAAVGFNIDCFHGRVLLGGEPTATRYQPSVFL